MAADPEEEEVLVRRFDPRQMPVLALGLVALAFMEHVDDAFTGQDGQMNRDQVRALVIFQLNRHKQLQAQLFPISVSETGPDTATAKFRALVTGGPGWIPDRGQVYDFQTGWKQDGSDWLLVSASWKPVPLDEVLEHLPAPSRD